MRQIIKNLSPLVGTTLTNKRWNPHTGYFIVKNLDITNLIELNLSNDTYIKGQIRYEFRNKVTFKTAEIYKAAKDFDDDVLDPKYLFFSDTKRQTPLEIREVVFLSTHLSEINDSAIVDIYKEDRTAQFSKYFKHVMFILLDSFSLRHSMYEYYNEGYPFPTEELIASRLDRLIGNIKYVRVKLEEEDKKKNMYLNHHLATLLYNVLNARYEINKKLIER